MLRFDCTEGGGERMRELFHGEEFKASLLAGERFGEKFFPSGELPFPSTLGHNNPLINTSAI
jgi:hypothetical protein